MDKLEHQEKLYGHIELSDYETRCAVIEAKEKKYDIIKAEEKRIARIKWQEEIRTPWNKEQLYEYVKYRAYNEFKMDGQTHPEFSITPNNEKIYKALCYYFTNDKKFEEMNSEWKLDKGLMIVGDVGLGKTMLMKLFSRNKRQSYDVLSARFIADKYAKDGPDVLDFFTQPKRTFFEDPTTFFQKQTGYCFDDLGTESDKKHYGNEVNVMADIILNRYDRKFEYPWCQTHVTTNLSADEIENFYGKRVRDRMREMFNKIVLTGESLRK